MFYVQIKVDKHSTTWEQLKSQKALYQNKTLFIIWYRFSACEMQNLSCMLEESVKSLGPTRMLRRGNGCSSTGARSPRPSHWFSVFTQKMSFDQRSCFMVRKVLLFLKCWIRWKMWKRWAALLWMPSYGPGLCLSTSSQRLVKQVTCRQILQKTFVAMYKKLATWLSWSFLHPKFVDAHLRRYYVE